MASPPPRVVVVDDDDSILRMIRLALEAAGFEVESASSPIGVGALVRRVAPHVVVLDVSMPGLDGEGVAGLLAKSTGSRRLPVVFYSALDEDALHTLSKRTPDSTYVQKGSPLPALVDAVRRMARLYASEAPPSR
ncbi:MAG TPA: response regulator [Polyangiaceae bacterium LLY-WYZ-15_(1-7)]|nr:response regulator [Polyangiaceae bacterium LLY-WYZ-15_(1-7)]HJL09806.1 response regulator [Polyangiaceae bacterium LLY-WYZ-15_(1-7)]HJL25504.1 response regulator [Polyangiaceae bacterium LLY-WYZ-15_(1-7)]HJL28650.1 response regulator [Polyangiaceae bacterium LLY-WYZ-15_(1-7)]HJL37697.1 response regulator [Polyangiaceae bacterium LLY-WYZ-15_(1-7)]